MSPGDDSSAQAPGEGSQPPAGTPARPPLKPQGEDVAWSALGSLLSGPIVWGGVGILLDRWFGTGRVLTAVGVVVGFLVAFYIVYLRFGRDD